MRNATTHSKMNYIFNCQLWLTLTCFLKAGCQGVNVLGGPFSSRTDAQNQPMSQFDLGKLGCPGRFQLGKASGFGLNFLLLPEK
jgi:hypothetical protein